MTKGKTIALIIVLILVGALAFGGYTAYQKISPLLDKYKEAKETLDKAKKSVDSLNDLKKKAEDFKDKAEKAVKDSVNELDKQVKDSGIKGSEKESENNFDYPAVYKQAGLPEYPKAHVVDLGDQQDSLEKGLILSLETHSTFQEVIDYYDLELTKQGWTPSKFAVVSNTAVNKEYTKGQMSFMISGYNINTELHKYKIAIREK